MLALRVMATDHELNEDEMIITGGITKSVIGRDRRAHLQNGQVLDLGLSDYIVNKLKFPI
jgi:hypothetical protein